jgi:hypothetical protein
LLIVSPGIVNRRASPSEIQPQARDAPVVGDRRISAPRGSACRFLKCLSHF